MYQYTQNEEGIDLFGKVESMAKISPKSFYKIIQRKLLFEKFLKDLSTVENGFSHGLKFKKAYLAVYLRRRPEELLIVLYFGK